LVSELPETHVTRSSDGTILAYHLIGKGPLDLVFYAPGVPIELLWEEPGFTRIVRRLVTFSRVIALEPRGLGASEGDPRDSFRSDLGEADFLATMEAAGSQTAVLVGWSTQGSAMVRLAALHPERVNTLIMINSCAHYVREDDYPWGFPRERLDDVTQFLEESWGSASDLDVTAPSRAADDHLRFLWGRARRSAYSRPNYAGGLRLSLEWDARPFLSLVSCPTLVLHREGDRFVHLGAGRYLAEHIAGAKFVVLPGDDHLYFIGDTDSLVDEIEEFLTGSRAGAEANVRTTNILFTDIVGSTEQQARLGPREWSRLADSHEVMVRDTVARHHGRAVKSTGAGHLATFEAAGSALRCADEILTRARSLGLELRAGIHTGDVEVRGDDIGGLPVSIAKRVCDLAGPGEVFVSETVKTLLTGSSFAFNEQGPYELKGVPGSWRLYRMVS
jgi:class 3 adenylate cyclase